MKRVPLGGRRGGPRHVVGPAGCCAGWPHGVWWGRSCPSCIPLVVGTAVDAGGRWRMLEDGFSEGARERTRTSTVLPTRT